MGYGADSYVTNDNVNPMRFVSLVPNAEYTVIQATGSTPIVGVSGTSTERFDSVYHATSGHTCRVYGKGEFPLVELGGNVTAGDYLISDTVGKAVRGSVSSSNQQFGGRARGTGNTGEFIRIEVLSFEAKTA